MKSRKGVEVLSRSGERRLKTTDPSWRTRWSPTARATPRSSAASSSSGWCSGELRTVITTDALELGIDIGELDAAVVVTFPGTVASLRQMWGRAGRRGRGLALYVAGEDALDQFFCRHPEDFLERPVEAAILDHESPLIYRQHLLLRCARGAAFGERRGVHRAALARRTRRRSRATGELRRRTADGPQATLTCPAKPGGYPAAEVSLRSASPDSFAIVDVSSGELLGSTEAARAHSTVHEGADLPAPGPLLRGGSARPRAQARAGVPVRGRLVHAAQTRHGRPRSCGCWTAARRLGVTPLVRRGQRDGHGARLSAQASADHARCDIVRARSAAHELLHAGFLVRAADGLP